MDDDSKAGSLMGQAPLTGLTVVEMTIAIQGPGAGMFLGDMGARVIKIEPPVGDAARYHRGVNNPNGVEVMGAQFAAMNRGKHSVCIDANSPDGHAAVLKLLATADVFISNFRASALERMGFGYDAMHKHNPRLVYAIANGFGPEGAEADKVMLDGAAIARGGLASVTGTVAGGPTAPGATVADTAGAMQLALAIMTALYARERVGAGQRVRTSALGAQLWLQQWELTHTWMTGKPLLRSGPHHPNIASPYGIYETKDGAHYLFAIAYEDSTWDEFWVFVDDPAEALNPMWSSRASRLGTGSTPEGTEAVQAKMRTVFKSKTAAEWEAFLSAHPDIVYERVRDYFDVREDPQNLANHYIEPFQVPGIGELSMVGNLLDFSATPARTHGGPPELGADTAQVLAAAGFSEDAIAAMVAHATHEREEAMKVLFG